MIQLPDDINQPTGPRAGSIALSASVIVKDRSGRILLEQSRDNDLWALPDGTVEFGDSIEETAVREVREETGFRVRLTGLVGIYTDDRQPFACDDGEPCQEFNLCFAASVAGHREPVTQKSRDLAFVMPDQLTGYPMHPTIRRRIQDHLSHERAPQMYCLRSVKLEPNR